MIITLLEAFGSATLQNSVIAISSWFGPDYLQGILSGQGANGAIVSLLQLLASVREFESTPEDNFGSSEDLSPIIHISQDKIRNGSFTFYIGSTIFGVFALLSFMMLCSLPFYKQVMKSNKKKVTSSIQRLSIEGERSTDQLLQSTEYSTEEPFPTNPIKPVNLRSVEPKIRSLGLSVFWVFFVTLAVFPSITGSIISTNSAQINPSKSSAFLQNWRNPLIFIPLHFLCFNCGDWLGRIIPQLFSNLSTLLIQRKKVLWSMSFFRIGFVPLFLLCNIEKSSVVLFKNDFVYFLILSLFAISNGFTSTLLMIAGVAEPSLEPEEIAVAATCMSLYLTSGLAMGSFVSFGVKALTTVL
ncbi:nucleoside transporter-domain-containing protein [Melampsora americana]|nr:nucleoside transporter-domain-containing protein [Melampsora americana]